jgi:hypothetical protein
MERAVVSKPIDFDQALKKAEGYGKKHLLLGNGFSIACKPDIFSYGSLFEEAEKTMSKELAAIFGEWPRSRQPPNHTQGATGPSLLGTGDGRITFVRRVPQVPSPAAEDLGNYNPFPCPLHKITPHRRTIGIEKPMKELVAGVDVASAFPNQSLRNLPDPYLPLFTI